MKLFGHEVNLSNWAHFRAGILCGAVGFVAALALFIIVNKSKVESDDIMLINVFLFFCSAVLFAAIIGILKELIWDKWLKKGTYEFLDIVFTTFGGAVGGMIFALFVIIVMNL